MKKQTPMINKELPNPTIFSLLIRLWGQLSTRRKCQLSFTLFILLIGSFLEMLSIGAVIPFIGILVEPEKLYANSLVRAICILLGLDTQIEFIRFTTFFFIGAVFISGVIRFFILWVQTKLSYGVGADISQKIYQVTLYQPYHIHIERNSGEVIAGLTTKVATVISNAMMPVLSILNAAFLVLIFGCTALIFEPTVAAFVMVGFGSVYLCVMYFTRATLNRNGRQATLEQANVIKTLQEGLGGVRDVLLDGTQKVFCDIYKQRDLRLRQAQSNIAIIGNSPRFVIESLSIILMAAGAYLLSLDSGGISSAMPILGALVLMAQRILPLTQNAFASWASLQGGRASLQDTIELLEQQLEYLPTEEVNSHLDFENAITLNDISFKYKNENLFVLNKITIKITKGSRIGLIGTSGSGKSTLLDIIMGLLTPTTGSLIVDDTEITTKNMRLWQRYIAHVPQFIFIADLTIAENIAFGVPLESIDMTRVVKAAKIAQLDGVIMSTKLGYNTPIGERGVRFSGGQRQRLGIARALYKEASIIIFDEATSALDSETELAVMESIDNLSADLTIIIVAHRVSTLINTDQIIKIANGVVEEVGSYESFTNL